MSRKFTKTLEITYNVKSVINEDGVDVSDNITDDVYNEIMEATDEEAQRRALDYVCGELHINLYVDDVEYNVYGWFDKKVS